MVLPLIPSSRARRSLRPTNFKRVVGKIRTFCTLLRKGHPISVFLLPFHSPSVFPSSLFPFLKSDGI